MTIRGKSSRKILLPIGLLLVAVGVGCAQPRSPKEEILGVWRGTSICTKVPGNEACHEETVIYDFRDGDYETDTVSLHADKIVNGEVVPMCVLNLAYDSAQHRWSAEFRNARVHILWSYVVHGKEMVGRCVDLPSMVVRRNVLVRRR